MLPTAQGSSGLLSRLQSKDQAAFKELYRTYKGLLLYTIHTLLPDREEAADLAQECFLKIWNGIDSYDPQKGSLVHWMVRIARNTTIDFMRSKYQGQKIQTTGLDTMLVPTHCTFRMPIDSLDLPGLVRCLEPSYREVIEWTYFRGYTQAEVAHHFDLPLGTVKTRARIGLRELRKIYLYQQVGCPSR